jgi:hypothetical protein
MGNAFSILGRAPSQVQFIVLVSYPLPVPFLDVRLDYFTIDRSECWIPMSCCMTCSIYIPLFSVILSLYNLLWYPTIDRMHIYISKCIIQIHISIVLPSTSSPSNNHHYPFQSHAASCQFLLAVHIFLGWVVSFLPYVISFLHEPCYFRCLCDDRIIILLLHFVHFLISIGPLSMMSLLHTQFIGCSLIDHTPLPVMYL